MLGEPEQYQGAGPFPLVGDCADPLRQRAAAEGARRPQGKQPSRSGRKKWEIHYEACITDPKACCLVDGKRKDYDGYQGHFALTAHRYQTKGRPLVMDTDKSPIYKPSNGSTRAKAAGCTRAASSTCRSSSGRNNKTGKGSACDAARRAARARR